MVALGGSTTTDLRVAVRQDATPQSDSNVGASKGQVDIIVGVVVGIVSLVGILCLLWCLYHRSSRPSPPSPRPFPRHSRRPHKPSPRGSETSQDLRDPPFIRRPFGHAFTPADYGWTERQEQPQRQSSPSPPSSSRSNFNAGHRDSRPGRRLSTQIPPVQQRQSSSSASAPPPQDQQQPQPTPQPRRTQEQEQQSKVPPSQTPRRNSDQQPEPSVQQRVSALGSATPQTSSAANAAVNGEDEGDEPEEISDDRDSDEESNIIETTDPVDARRTANQNSGQSAQPNSPPLPPTQRPPENDDERQRPKVDSESEDDDLRSAEPGPSSSRLNPNGHASHHAQSPVQSPTPFHRLTRSKGTWPMTRSQQKQHENNQPKFRATVNGQPIPEGDENNAGPSAAAATPPLPPPPTTATNITSASTGRISPPRPPPTAYTGGYQPEPTLDYGRNAPLRDPNAGAAEAFRTGLYPGYNFHSAGITGSGRGFQPQTIHPADPYAGGLRERGQQSNGLWGWDNGNESDYAESIVDPEKAARRRRREEERRARLANKRQLGSRFLSAKSGKSSKSKNPHG